MSIINFPSNSPYYATPQTTWYTSNYVFRPIPPDTSGGDSLITSLESTYQYRPDRLSYDLYNTPAYWWIFCVRNPFLRPDPIWSFTTGISIYVPSLAYLNKVLGT